MKSIKMCTWIENWEILKHSSFLLNRLIGKGQTDGDCERYAEKYVELSEKLDVNWKDTKLIFCLHQHLIAEDHNHYINSGERGLQNAWFLWCKEGFHWLQVSKISLYSWLFPGWFVICCDIFRFGRCSNTFSAAGVSCTGEEGSVANCRWYLSKVIEFRKWSILRIQLKLNTALLSTVRPSVCPSVTGVTSHISHIYKGINAMLIIRDPSTPIYSESKSSWLSF